MLMTSADFRDVTEPFMNEKFDGRYERLRQEWNQIWDVEMALPRRYQEFFMIYGLGIAQEKGEGQGVTYDTGGIEYRVRCIFKSYALACAMTEELIEDGDHIGIGALFARYLADGMHEAKEIVHATPFNRAFNASYPGGDGKEWLATDHPLVGGGTWSNELATPANISEAAFEQILQQIRTAQDARGKYIGLEPKDVIIHPNNRHNLYRILMSKGRVATANNDANAIKEMGELSWPPKYLTRLTNTKQWGIKTNAELGMKSLRRVAMQKKMEGDFETGSMRYKARERYECLFIDPRSQYGSPGI